jgi:hypothetical protein
MQAVTFRLADSLPSEVRSRMKRNIEQYPEDIRATQWRRRINEWLDKGHGYCLLGQPGCAQHVADALQFFHRRRYDLIAWVVMPNHPSGTLDPSADDMLITKKIIAVAKLLDIIVHDHVIVDMASTNFYSFSDRGMMTNLKNEARRFLNQL